MEITFMQGYIYIYSMIPPPLRLIFPLFSIGALGGDHLKR